jgi:hypothetical protein
MDTQYNIGLRRFGVEGSLIFVNLFCGNPHDHKYCADQTIFRNLFLTDAIFSEHLNQNRFKIVPSVVELSDSPNGTSIKTVKETKANQKATKAPVFTGIVQYVGDISDPYPSDHRNVMKRLHYLIVVHLKKADKAFAKNSDMTVSTQKHYGDYDSGKHDLSEFFQLCARNQLELELMEKKGHRGFGPMQHVVTVESLIGIVDNTNKDTEWQKQNTLILGVPRVDPQIASLFINDIEHGYIKEAFVRYGFPACESTPHEWFGERFQHIIDVGIDALCGQSAVLVVDSCSVLVECWAYEYENLGKLYRILALAMEHDIRDNWYVDFFAKSIEAVRAEAFANAPASRIAAPY